MQIAWYLGFGWTSIAIVVACGIGIRMLGDGAFAWALYLPFLVVALYMSVRFRLFTTQPWRRVHARTMLAYARFASREYDRAKAAGRAFSAQTPCRELAESVLHDQASEALLGDERKPYYASLVTDFPQVFVEGLDAARHEKALAGVRTDIDASELGPDIVIAQAIQRKHGRLEAARYLHALLLGKVR